MKLHHYLLMLIGAMPSHAVTAEFVQHPFDYPFIEGKNPIEDQNPKDEKSTSNLINLGELAQDFILETKKIEIPSHPFAFNPSIIRWNGSLLMSFRTYTEAKSTNPFALVWLDEDFNPIGTPQIFELPFDNPVLASKQQDPRLITAGGRLFVVYNNILEDVTHREIRRMYIVEMRDANGIFTATEPECLRNFEAKNEMRYEKNWVPFTYEGELLLTYSIIPHKILRPLSGTNSCETLFTTGNSFKWDWGVPRGGSQAILDGDHYLSFFHSWVDVPTVESNGKKITHYVMGAYTFDSKPPFTLISASPDPIVAKDFYEPPYYRTWKPLRCVFPSGLLIDENYVWVTYGRQDHEMWIAKIDKKGLLKSLVPVSSN